MKKIAALLIIFTCCTANAQSIYDLDKKYGFREVQFEDSLSNYPTMKAFDQTKDSAFISYRKTDENFIVNGTKVDIVYTFFKGQLATVFIQTYDSLGSRQVLNYFQNLYGKGKQEDPYVEKHLWYGSKVILAYYEDINTFKARIFISSVKMKLKSEGRDKY